jgi:hypothetical protein
LWLVLHKRVTTAKTELPMFFDLPLYDLSAHLHHAPFLELLTGIVRCTCMIAISRLVCQK